MKNKNKILSAILSVGILSAGFAGAISFPSKNFCSYGASSDFVSIGESNVLGMSVNEKHRQYQVKGFELVRVVEDRYGGAYLHFRHEKTGAQFVVDTKAPGESVADIFFPLRFEEDNGVYHVLEQCIEASVFASKNEKIINKSWIYETGMCFFCDDMDLTLHKMLSQLKDPDFIKDKSIFERESKKVYYKMKRIIGSSESKGKHVEIDEFKRLAGIFMINNNKLTYNFIGGVPEKIEKLTQQDVCEAYDRFIHPSNMFVFVRGKNWEKSIETFRDEYLNYYDERDIDLTYGLECIEFKEENEYVKRKVETNDSNKPKYSAFIIYDLKKLGLHRDEIDILSGICMVMNIKYKRYNCNFEVDAFGFSPSLKIEFFGNDSRIFEKDVLNNFATNKWLKDLLSPEFFDMLKRELGDFGVRGPKNNLFDRCRRGFMVYNDPFSEELFAIETDNFLVPTFRDINIESTALLNRFTDHKIGKIKKPDRIMVLEPDFKTKP